jgi:predicted N-formylglutamate amidohydrolase
MVFLVTCEHGSSQIPDWLAADFSQLTTSGASDIATAVADGFDLGALDAANHFAKTLRCPIVAAKHSPLIVDVNRSVGQRGLLSEYSRRLPKKIRERILREIHEPYRRDVEAAVERSIRQDDLVIHLSVHSFATFEPNQGTGASEDKVLSARRTDLGLLYDPARPYELALCLDWFDDLYYSLPMLRVRRNYPRRGCSENLISHFRRKYSPDSYIGIELQLNRAWCVRDVPVRKKVFSGIAKSLMRILDRSKDEQEQEAA